MIELRDILLILITCAITIPLTLGAERLIQIWTTQHPNTTVNIEQRSDSVIIQAHNTGKKIDRVRISLSTTENITDYKINIGDKVRLVQGGPIGNYAIFMIDELIPGTTKVITVTTKASEIRKAEAWSEYEGDLKVIPVKITMSFGPEESYQDYKKQ